jgi:hypothetical protein
MPYAIFCLGLMFRNAITLSLNQESLMSSKTSALSRRTLFSGAATVGAVAAATAVLPGVVKQGAPVVTALPKPTRGGGYTLSEHVQQYYKTTRV